MNQHSYVHKAGLALAVATALALPLAAQAGSFQLPTNTGASWARAGAGGSLYPDDPSAVYNNPAAIAFFSGPMLQATGTGIRPSSQFDGQFRDQSGNPVSGNNPNGFGKTKFFPNVDFAMPVSDRLTLGTSITVPYGLAGNYDPSWEGRYFGTATSLKSIALTFSAGFKVNDEFAIGLGLVGQYTNAQLNTAIDTAGVVNSVLGSSGTPDQSMDTQLNVHVKKKLSFGYIAGFAWKPTKQDTFGFSYHSKIQNTLSGKYSIYAGAQAKGILGLTQGPLGAALGLPPISADGGNASARLDTPASANLDWVHFFDDRFSLAASVQWTGWSSFEELALYSNGNQLVALPEKYKDAWTYSIGGEYKLTPVWTLRAGVGYDQTPTSLVSRDPRIPDGSRRLVGVGVGYQATQHLVIDLGYQHQFVSDMNVSQTNPLILGGGTMSGKFKDSGDVLSMTGTYHF